MTAPLPRLTYIGDIPIEASYQSSVLLHRLLQGYPNGLLQIIETRAGDDRAELRLPGVEYHRMPVAEPRLMRGRFGAAYRLWLTATAARRAAEVSRVLAAFAPTAVLTIASGFGWLVAAEVAERHGLPLHVIAHDDWPKPHGVDRILRSWSRAKFARVYRRARSRLCISPFMIDEFEQRYGVRGELLYPMRSSSAVSAAEPRTRVIENDDQIEVAFAGGSGPHVMPGLIALGRALSHRGARIVVLGPFDEAKRDTLRSVSSAFDFRGFADQAQIFAALRQADVLFLPMTFDERAHDNMAVSLPSKLVDYTAAGVPMIIHAPPYAGASRWAALHHPVAAVVSSGDVAALRDAIDALAVDRDRREQLAQGALAAGAECFSNERGRAVFEAALR